MESSMNKLCIFCSYKQLPKQHVNFLETLSESLYKVRETSDISKVTALRF